MPYYEVDVEVTYRGVVTVEAHSARQAMAVAEAGPGEWLNGIRPEAEDYLYTEAVEAHQQGGSSDVDEMQSWRELQELIDNHPNTKD